VSSQGPTSGSVFVSDATLGTVAVTNPGNALRSDNSYAAAALLLGQSSRYLKTTGFGFSIPRDATIDGLLVEVERSSNTASAIVDNSVRIVKNGTITGDEKASAGSWPTSDAYASYGAATDKWGTGWTPSDINTSNFGLVFSARALLAATAQIDHVRVTVYFTGSNRVQIQGKCISVGSGMSRNEIAS